MNRKALENTVREVIGNTNQLICDSALHLAQLTGEKDWVKCCEKMDPVLFKEWAGIPHATWMKLINGQQQYWRDLVQAQFEINYNKQLRIAAEVMEQA